MVSYGRVVERKKENLSETYKDSPVLVIEALETEIPLQDFTG